MKVVVSELDRKKRLGSYRDFAEVALAQGPPTKVNPFMLPADMKAIHLSLPEKLQVILTNQDFEQIITWMPHGRAWRIRDLDRFTSLILPVYFDLPGNTGGLSTFLRLLKVWGFRQITEGADITAYYHELFLRGTDLHRLMRPSEANIRNAILDVSPSPDLYAVPPMPDTRKSSVGPSQQSSSWESSLAAPPELSAAQDLHDRVVARLNNTGKTKKPRKKWLPPLGPPPQKDVVASRDEWLHKSAETFASFTK